MRFVIELYDENGTTIVTGPDGGHYESSQPIPIPLTGDYVLGEWVVMRRQFVYEQVGENTNTTVLLYCRQELLT